jgi:hypothetical protein
MLSQNAKYQLPSDAVSDPRRMDTLVILLQKPKILCEKEFNTEYFMSFSQRILVRGFS